MKTTNDLQEKISSLSFEQAMSELEKIVQKLENGQETLENAIADYEYGNLLRSHCEKKLEEAKLKIQQINQKVDGSVAFEEFK